MAHNYHTFTYTSTYTVIQQQQIASVAHSLFKDSHLSRMETEIQI